MDEQTKQRYRQQLEGPFTQLEQQLRARNRDGSLRALDTLSTVVNQQIDQARQELQASPG
jgi:hypothetical protein